jgi:polysaccharide chain length determinant protein (PEP-CTERM system associated)
MEQATMTPMELLAIVRRRRMSLVVPALVVIALGLAVALLLPSIYKATATIMIEEQEIPTDFVMTTVTSYAEQRIQQLTQRIMSFTRLMEIINRFKLYEEMKERSTTEEIVEQMRKDTELKPVSAEIIDRRTGRPTAATIAFTLSYQGKNANTVQQVANVLTSLYLEENLKVRARQAEETAGFLESETARVKQELAEIEARIAEFKKIHINALPEVMQLNLQTLSGIERGVEVAGEQLRGQREREGYLQAQLSGIKPHTEKEDELVSKKRIEELKVQLVSLTQRFSDEHPDVKKTRAEIAQLEERLVGIDSKGGRGAPDNPAYITLSAQLASTRVEVQGLQRQIEKLNADAAEYRRRIATTPKVEEEYNGLLAARNSTQAKVNDLTRKMMEARVSHGLEKEQMGERFTLVDPPRLPEKPFKPNRLAILLIGVVLGIGAGVGFAALREFSDDSVHTAEQLETATQFPVLAGIPVIETARDLRRKRTRRAVCALGTAGALAAGILVFHFFVMDLDVFWVKLVRKMPI